MKFLSKKTGQAAVEYVLILFCISLICMAGAKVFHLMILQCYKNFVAMLLIPFP